MKKIVLISMLATTLLMAEAPDTAKDDLLVTHTELSYINTKGNTDTESFAMEAKAKKGWGRHIFSAKGEAFYSKDGETTTKNKWLLEGTYDYEFTKRFAFSYLIGYKSDKFSSYDYQFYTGPGAKYKVIDTEKHALNTKANVLYSQDDIREDPNAVPVVLDKTNDYISWLAGFDYTWQVLDNLKFLQEATYRSQFDDSDNYFVYSKTAIESKINGNFSMGISYKIDYANTVAPDKERTDKTFLVSLIIDY